MPTNLKLIVLEPSEIDMVSALLQDAVLRVGDLVYSPATKRFVVMSSRYDWMNDGAGNTPAVKTGERHRTALRIERVLAVRSQGIDLARKDDVLSLLAIQYETAAEPPAGRLMLLFAGGGTIQLDVECVEAALEDSGAAWRAIGRPQHAE